MTDASAQNAAQSSRSNASRALRNVVFNWGGFALAGLVNFALAPFVLRHLGNSYYGLTVLLLSLTGYLGLLDLGARGAMTRYVAKFHSQFDHESSSRLVSSALALFILIGILAILLCLGLGIFAGALPIPANDLSWTRIFLILLGPNVAISLISGVFSGVPMALQRFDPVNIIGVLMTLARALAIVLALSVGGGLLAVAVIQLGSTSAATLVTVGVNRRLYPELQVRWHGFDRKHILMVLSFSAFSFTLLVFDTAIIYLNSLVVGAFISVSMVTFFAIASNLVNYVRAIVGGISKTSTPQASALEASGDIPGIRRAMVNAGGDAMMVTLPMAATFMIRGKSFIGLWMGPEYAELSGQVLWILTLGLIFSAATQVALAASLGIGRHKELVKFFLGQALCNLILDVVFIRKWGIVGVAWATTLPYLAMSLFFWPWYVRRTLGVPVRTYLWSAWVRTLLAITPFAGCTWLVERLWPASTLLVFFAQVAAVTPIAIVVFWFGCLARERRQLLSPLLLQSVTRFF